MLGSIEDHWHPLAIESENRRGRSVPLIAFLTWRVPPAANPRVWTTGFCVCSLLALNSRFFFHYFFFLLRCVRTPRNQGCPGFVYYRACPPGFIDCRLLFSRAAQVASEPWFEFMWDEIMMKLNCCDEFPVGHVPCHLGELLVITDEDKELEIPFGRRTRVKRAQFRYLYLRTGKPEGAQPSNSICHLILTKNWSGWRYNGWRYKIYSIFNPVSPGFSSKLTCSKGLRLETTIQWCISDVKPCETQPGRQRRLGCTPSRHLRPVRSQRTMEIGAGGTHIWENPFKFNIDTQKTPALKKDSFSKA